MARSRMKRFTEEFRREAIGPVQTSGRSIGEVVGDLEVGKSMLGQWLTRYHETELLSGPHDNVQKELA